MLARAGVVEIELNGRKTPATILTFDNAYFIIGMETIEALGLRLDPSNGN